MMDVGSALGYGGIVMVIGMLIVFTGLTILIICISIMGKIFKSINQKKKTVTPEPAPIPAPVEAPVPEAAAADPMADTQLIAVIAAALAAYDKTGKQLVIKKVRRVNAWNGAARAEQIIRF